MPLDTYKLKRNFNKTPEPTGGKPVDKKLHFVIQKHHASHLHYDFRLELRGILKSWAVPKGPSMIAGEKRLAMLVEDHPWDYRTFEGIIPSGYGAGTVIVWDEGTYETTVIKEKDKKAQEHSITSQFWKGQIKLSLRGHKVKGEFTITRAKEKGENAWYLIKQKDKYVTTKDITKKDKSVYSKLTIEEMTENADAKEWQSHKPAYKSKNEQKEVPAKDDNILNLIRKGKRLAFPTKIEPMLSTLVREPFNDDKYLYEVKLDGYRVIAYLKKKQATLSSRSGLNYSKYYTSVINELSQFDFDVVLDGEIVALNEKGQPDFDALQKNNGTKPLAFYAFDILWYNGYSLMNLPLQERKEILIQILPQNEIIKYSESFDDGLKLFELMNKLEMEGIVAKLRDSTYQPGKRGKDWLKIQTEKRQEFVIGGWAESESGTAFRTLLFGAYEKGRFKFVGHAGHGFKEKDKPSIKAKLKKLEIKKSPFINAEAIDVETEVHWVKPEMVANIKFATLTSSGKIRKPAIFLGFRDDKEAAEVIEEIAEDIPAENRTEKKSATSTKPKKITPKKEFNRAAYDSNWKEIEKLPVTSKDIITIEGNEVELTNVEKKLWDGVTKADLITYYASISNYILPYLKDRPQSLHIKHLRPTAPGLYIKDMEGRQPEWAEVFTTHRKHKKKGKRDVIDYLVCQDKATLVYMINLGCIDINPWTSRITNYQQPDFIVIDLDPSDEEFSKAIKTALEAKKFFDNHKLKAFLKTSGKTGLHIYIPCKGFSFPEARTIAINISQQISSKIPDIATSENTIAHRGDKIFIDFNQNDEADTVAAPYSARPSKAPTVSTPLEWKEINEKLHPSNFHIGNIIDRIKKKGDLFKGVLNKNTAGYNSKILKQFL